VRGRRPELSPGTPVLCAPVDYSNGLPLAEWRPLPVRLADVGRPGADEPVVLQLFETVGRPATGACDGERRREQFLRDADAVQQDGGVELDVRLQAEVRPVLGEHVDSGVLELAGGLEERALITALVERFGGRLEDGRPGSRTS